RSSDLSTTIEPISWERSPRRLMRFEVSWIWSRMESIPAIVSRTTPAPLVAICTERWATSADSAELRDTWLIDCAISLMRSDAELISCAWCSRSEEHTSELQSRENLVCRLLLEKKKNADRPSNG